jgi:hypothetical protein
MAKIYGTQGDGSLRAYFNAAATADATIRMNPGGLLDHNNPDRTAGFA